jgi:phosphate transport system protein
MEIEARVNLMEVEIDRELSSIIARRQPTARDLPAGRHLKTSQPGTRGDEAVKIARMVKSIGSGRRAPCRPRSGIAADRPPAIAKALDAFARLDANAAVSILKEDNARPRVRRIRAQLITYMMEDPRTISPSLDLLFVAKAIERSATTEEHRRIHHLRGQGRTRHTSMEQIGSVVR